MVRARCRSRPGAAEAFDLARFLPWAILVNGPAGEHLALSDGRNRIRLDIIGGSVRTRPSALRFELTGLDGLDPQLATLRRLGWCARRRRFPAHLFASPTRAARRIEVLRVADALAAGASQREIAEELFGEARMRAGWLGATDHLRSRLRRLVREARDMARGGYRALLFRGTAAR